MGHCKPQRILNAHLFTNIDTTTWENKHRMSYLITLDSFTGEQVSSTLVLNFMTCLAAITGIHGVSSSEWFPISQSVVGKRKPLLGVMAFS